MLGDGWRGRRTAGCALTGLTLLAAACSAGAETEGGAGSTAGAAAATAGPSTLPPPPDTAAATTVASSATEPPATEPSTDGPVVTPLPPAAIDLEVPAVDGFTYTPVPDLPVPWIQLALPEGGGGLSLGVREGGVPIGSLVVADGITHERYLDRLFDEPVQIVRGSTETVDETLYVTNTARARWLAVSEVPVVAATLPDGELGQWVWRHDDLTWIATGGPGMERWLTGLLAVQQPPAPERTHDYSLVGGSLYRDLPIVQPYVYIDAPVVDVVSDQMQRLAGDCARHVYAGSVVAVDDPAALTAEPTDLVLHAATIAGACRADGWFEQLDDQLAELGFVDDVIGDVAVRRRDGAVIVVDGDDVYQLGSADPATLLTMAPFITAFVTGDRPADVTDDTTLPVGTCLFRAPAANGDEASRRTFAVGCAEPHQGEVFHRFDITAAPDEPYPGDVEAARRADEGCANGFSLYVGIPHDESRLDVLYYYPSADTWVGGDRGVMCILHGATDELFRTTLAGSRQ